MTRFNRVRALITSLAISALLGLSVVANAMAGSGTPPFPR